MDSCLWRIGGFVYFLLTFIQMVTSHGFLSNCCVYFNIECCRKPLVEYDGYSLTKDLAKFHGQPLASSYVSNFLEYHFNSPTKPIFFYLHGDTGTGKTFLTRLIIKNIYHYGTNSKFVKFFHLKKDYFEDGKDTILTDLMTMTIRDKVSSCPQSLFVFDGYSDCWLHVMEYILYFKRNFMEAIFIFIQNSDVQHIHAYMQKKQNHKDAMHYEDLLEGAKRENKLLENANLVYVPFLPMHREDVHKCISDQLDELKVHWTIKNEESITEIMALIEFTNNISISGCKKVADKTALFLAQYNRRQEL